MAHHIAQLNVGRTVAPLDTPQLADFMAWLDAINAIADASRASFWRLQGDSGNNTDLKVGDDPLFIVNMSVWELIEALHGFTYRSDHKAVFARRYEWFERADGPNMVLWWVPAGSIPTVDDALARLNRLAELGPTPPRRSRSRPCSRRRAVGCPVEDRRGDGRQAAQRRRRAEAAGAEPHDARDRRRDGRAAARRSATLFEATVTDGTGRIRVEDLLTAGAAVSGESCIAAAGESTRSRTSSSPARRSCPTGSTRSSARTRASGRRRAQSVFGVIRAGVLRGATIPPTSRRWPSCSGATWRRWAAATPTAGASSG